MPDSKITALTSISTSTDPANDPLVIVDVSDTSMAATGTTKKVTLNQLLGASGTATLASATITGDLTVKTNVLKVDTTNNRVGVVNASPAYPLDVVGNINTDSELYSQGGRIALYRPAGASYHDWASGQSLIWRTVTSVGGAGPSELMRLNSTGLGVGVSPSYKLDIFGTVRVGTANPIVRLETGTNTGFIDYNDTRLQLHAGPLPMYFVAGNTLKMTLDATGNLGLGVTPSAWASIYKTIEFANGSSIWGQTDIPQLSLQTNAFLNSSFQWIYKTTAAASNYRQNAGAHLWFNAPSGTAGTVITFTQSMTLDASGNLLLATTTNTPSARQYINQASGSNPALYIAGGASTTPLINFNGAGRMRSDGQYLVMETTNASGVIYVTANTNGVYLSVGGTSWTANSDERLKDIIEPISNAVQKVGSLRSVIGKFKNDETNTRRSFLIAQDVQAVLPEAVDASNPDKLGVAYSEVIPLLVAAIKELTARVQTLETR